MIKYEFTKDEENFIKESIPKQFKRLYDIISVKVMLDDIIKVKVRLKPNGEFLEAIIRLDNITQIRREFILNEILK